MRKILLVLSCLLMLCALLCGCGEETVPEMASEVVSDVESGMDGVVSDMDGMIGNETTDSTQSDSMIADSSEGSSEDTSTQAENGTENSTENMM